MTSPDTLFLQLHTLTSYPGVLLNRDDAGFAKRLPFGGATRTRISSQCLKRHWRTFQGEHSLTQLAPPSLRSRYTFELRIARPLQEQGFPALLTHALVSLLMDDVLGSKSDKKSDGVLKTGQITVLGTPEVSFLGEEAQKMLETLREQAPDLFEKYEGIPAEPEEGEEPVALDKAEKKILEELYKKAFDKEAKKNLKAVGLAGGLDAALFGRMVTSDLLARGDAAIHVAHALTVHAEESESDYFSAIDDLLGELAGGDEEQRGSGHINSTELNSGLYYSYVVVDVPLLVSNLTGVPRAQWRSADLGLAQQVIERFVHIMATVSPGAKLGSTAPYAHAQCVLVEAGRAQPRTLANAFQTPVATRGDVLKNTYEALATFWREHTNMYGRSNKVRLSGMGELGALEEALEQERQPLSQTASWLASMVEGAS